MEVLGLEESYNTFYKECVGKGVPLPNDLPDPSFPKTNFNLCDGKQFLEYFDSENGEALAEVRTTSLTLLNYDFLYLTLHATAIILSRCGQTSFKN